MSDSGIQNIFQKLLINQQLFVHPELIVSVEIMDNPLTLRIRWCIAGQTSYSDLIYPTSAHAFEDLQEYFQWYFEKKYDE